MLDFWEGTRLKIAVTVVTATARPNNCDGAGIPLKIGVNRSG